MNYVSPSAVDVASPWPSNASLFQLSTAHWISQTISVCARLGIADLLEDGPRSSQALAVATDTHPGALTRLLRSLAQLGVVAERANGTYLLTELGDGLRSNASQSLRAWAMVQGEEWNWQPWGQLLHTVQTGEPAFEHVYSTGRFAYFADHPEVAAKFDAGMTSVTNQETRALVDAYDFGPAECVVDVAGGKGIILRAILESNPTVRGVLFDLPHVIERARSMLERSDVGDRCALVGGDFFKAIPGGGDSYLLANVLHDWDDLEALRILKECRRAIPDRGRLLIIEHVLSAGSRPVEVDWIDLHMLVMYRGGHQRTPDELRAMLASTGFVFTNLIPTAAALSIVEARPV